MAALVFAVLVTGIDKFTIHCVWRNITWSILVWGLKIWREYFTFREYFTLGGCCGLEREYFSLGGCVCLERSIFPVRIFHSQENISLWEDVLVLKGLNYENG